MYVAVYRSNLTLCNCVSYLRAKSRSQLFLYNNRFKTKCASHYNKFFCRTFVESAKMAACIAVIGKDNSPKYIKCADKTTALQFHYKVHTSIDIIEEKLNVGNKTTIDIRDLYLGLLFATEEYKIYGYTTNTKIKFVIVLQSSNISLRDNEVKMIFKKLHTAYSNTVCNPFYIPEDQITSKSFDASISEIMSVI